MMKVLYFAWLRQKVGVGEEQLNVPAEVKTTGDLVNWLLSQGGGHAEAFKDMSAIKVAVNQEFADLETAVAANDEVAFFPPVTGG